MHGHHDRRTGEGSGNAAEARALGGVGRTGERRRLRLVLGITAAFMLAEAIGGWLAGSLALLADAGHMLTDVGALGLSLLAMRWAQRPASPDRTFGWVRAEILAALANGMALVVIAAVVVWEAVQRLRAPVAVDSAILLGVAAAGLLVNVAGLSLLRGHAHDNLNVKGAYLHVLGDLLGSIGALSAGAVIALTGWSPADPLASMLIALLILASAARLVRDAVDVLMEAAPRHVDVEAVLRDLSAIEGLHDVHDLHVWTLTSGFVALSAHGVIHDPRAQPRVLREVRERSARHGIRHVTFQAELEVPRRIRRGTDHAEGGTDGLS